MDSNFLSVLLGQLIAWLILALIFTYPFYLQRYKPDQYQGWWKTFQDLTKISSSRQLIQFLIAFAIALMIVTILLTMDSSIPFIGLIKTLLPLSLFFFLLFFTWQRGKQ